MKLKQPEISDRELVERALLGEEEAYRWLVDRFKRPIYSVLMRLVNDSGLAEDLTQETFIKAFRFLSSYDQERRLASWLFRIAHNTALDHLRRKRPATVTLETEDQDEGSLMAVLEDETVARPERAAEGKQQVRHLEAALAELSLDEREIILLRFSEGLSYQEIADVTGVAMGSVKTHIHRGRKRLAAALRGRGWE